MRRRKFLVSLMVTLLGFMLASNCILYLARHGYARKVPLWSVPVALWTPFVLWAVYLARQSRRDPMH